MNRPLSSAEKQLVRWMLANGPASAVGFLPQVDLLEVTSWKCQCGCASLQFEMEGCPASTGGMRPLAEYVFGLDPERSGIFVYEQAGRLAGIEVYGLTGEAAKTLPTISDLEPFGDRVRSR
jgi:hypothetical protein